MIFIFLWLMLNHIHFFSFKTFSIVAQQFVWIILEFWYSVLHMYFLLLLLCCKMGIIFPCQNLKQWLFFASQLHNNSNYFYIYNHSGYKNMFSISLKLILKIDIKSNGILLFWNYKCKINLVLCKRFCAVFFLRMNRILQLMHQSWWKKCLFILFSDEKDYLLFTSQQVTLIQFCTTVFYAMSLIKL